MTIEEAVVWAGEEVSRAEENARICYSDDISVEAMQRAAEKVKQQRGIREVLLKLFAIEKIIEEKDSYDGQDAIDHIDRIRTVLYAENE